MLELILLQWLKLLASRATIQIEVADDGGWKVSIVGDDDSPAVQAATDIMDSMTEPPFGIHLDYDIMTEH